MQNRRKGDSVSVLDPTKAREKLIQSIEAMKRVQEAAKKTAEEVKSTERLQEGKKA